MLLSTTIGKLELGRIWAFKDIKIFLGCEDHGICTVDIYLTMEIVYGIGQTAIARCVAL